MQRMFSFIHHGITGSFSLSETKPLRPFVYCMFGVCQKTHISSGWVMDKPASSGCAYVDAAVDTELVINNSIEIANHLSHSTAIINSMPLSVRLLIKQCNGCFKLVFIVRQKRNVFGSYVDYCTLCFRQPLPTGDGQ